MPEYTEVARGNDKIFQSSLALGCGWKLSANLFIDRLRRRGTIEISRHTIDAQHLRPLRN